MSPDDEDDEVVDASATAAVRAGAIDAPGGGEPASDQTTSDDPRFTRFSESGPGVHVPPVGGAGDVVVRADLAGTALFAITASLAAAFFTTAWQWIAAVTALVLFAVGVFTFLWSYYNAVQRSRTEEVTVSQLYVLLGPAIPATVRRTMLAALLVQVVVALATSLARLDGPDGRPGSSLALGFLVPMFGFGMNGLWAAYHATFPPRRRTDPSPAPRGTEAPP